MNNIIKTRQAYSLEKLSQLIVEINKIQNNSFKEICIYATGSFGRNEAGEKSDLDIFLISKEEKISNIDSILLFSELIKINEKLGFPKFSRDGMFLEIHKLDNILDIGSQSDDYQNSFTARMLYLLESKCIYNEKLYNDFLYKIINAYFTDFNDHEKNFRPIFLVNDILRYWRTLCLNYEHRRHREIDNKSDSKSTKVKAHRNNLKLKFSRMLTCYSFILDILNTKNQFNPDLIKEIAERTPIERMLKISDNNQSSKNKIKEILDLYEWFLDLMKEDDDWIYKEENRNLAFSKSRVFGSSIFEILIETASLNESGLLKYMII